MATNGLRQSSGGLAMPPYSRGPYVWNQQVTFTGGLAGANTKGSVLYVDGTSGSDGNDGTSWSRAKATIQAAITLAGAYGIVYVLPKLITDKTGDPTSYSENLIIPVANMNMQLIGISAGRTQGGLPQCKVGTTTTSPLLTIRAAGCLIANMGFNGAGATGSGILLDDDNSTKTAFGTTITGCHFKNCKGPDVDDAKEGGAIAWSSEGNAWQVLISGNRFYKNTCDITLLGTSNSVPQDVIIEHNDFGGPAASVDANLYLAGGSGMNGVTIRNNTFQQLPSYGANVNRYIDATGCVGVLADCTFGCQTNETGGTVITFKAAGTGAKIPTTMHIINCFGQTIDYAESGEIAIE